MEIRIFCFVYRSQNYEYFAKKCKNNLQDKKKGLDRLHFRPILAFTNFFRQLFCPFFEFFLILCLFYQKRVYICITLNNKPGVATGQIRAKKTMSNLQVANTIKEQLGHKALYMLGALNFVGSDNFLMFKIRGSRNVTHIKITLNSLDLYDMTFFRVRAGKTISEETVPGCYADMMHEVIEKMTGLYTKLF